MVLDRGVGRVFLLAFLVLGQVGAQTIVGAPSETTSSFDNVLRVTKVTINAQTASEPNGFIPAVEIQVQRLSDRTITAYGLSLSMKYADGSVKTTAHATDLIRSLVPDVPGFPADYSGLTQINQYQSQTYQVMSDDAGKPPVQISATVTWVAFDDKTVSGSGAGIQWDIQWRKEESRYLGNLVAELRAVEARPDISAALAESDSGSGSPALQTAVRDLKLEPSESPRTSMSGHRDVDLNNFAAAASISKDSEDKFDALVERYAKLQVLIADHSNLKENK